MAGNEKAKLKRKLQNFLQVKMNMDLEESQGRNPYQSQYQSLWQLTQLQRTDGTVTTLEGAKPHNYVKNRFMDILPYDHSRVILSRPNGFPGEDYINANYIPGVTNKHCYVAAQGPLPHTVNDFWRMIWDVKAKVVIMACNQIEGGKLRCQKYWVDKGEEVVFGDIKVSMRGDAELKERGETGSDFPEYQERHLVAERGGERRSVRQIHYIGWPDHGVPDTELPVLDMIAKARQYQPEETPAYVIHCSAGCGRTGTIILIDHVWSMLNTGSFPDNFDLYEILKTMREKRPSLVQSWEQYKFVHTAIEHLFRRHLDYITKHVYENVNIASPRDDVTTRGNEVADEEGNEEVIYQNMEECEAVVREEKMSTSAAPQESPYELAKALPGANAKAGRESLCMMRRVKDTIQQYDQLALAAKPGTDSGSPLSPTKPSQGAATANTWPKGSTPPISGDKRNNKNLTLGTVPVPSARVPLLSNKPALVTKPVVTSSKPSVTSPKPGGTSLKLGGTSPKPGLTSPKPGGASPKPGVTPSKPIVTSSKPQLSREGSQETGVEKQAVTNQVQQVKALFEGQPSAAAAAVVLGSAQGGAFKGLGGNKGVELNRSPRSGSDSGMGSMESLGAKSSSAAPSQRPKAAGGGAVVRAEAAACDDGSDTDSSLQSLGSHSSEGSALPEGSDPCQLSTIPERSSISGSGSSDGTSTGAYAEPYQDERPGAGGSSTTDDTTDLYAYANPYNDNKWTLQHVALDPRVAADCSDYATVYSEVGAEKKVPAPKPPASRTGSDPATRGGGGAVRPKVPKANVYEDIDLPNDGLYAAVVKQPAVARNVSPNSNSDQDEGCPPVPSKLKLTEQDEEPEPMNAVQSGTLSKSRGQKLLEGLKFGQKHQAEPFDPKVATKFKGIDVGYPRMMNKPKGKRNSPFGLKKTKS